MSMLEATAPAGPGGGKHSHGATLTEAAAHGASTRIVVGYGFWIFLISDIIMFAAFFATFAVLADSTAGGPTGRQLFEVDQVALETAALLTSSLFCGFAGLAALARNTR
ncbi:MAG: cyoC, partial [Variovorax sp.]|nr:cyoC [Variovorax sp.]